MKFRGITLKDTFLVFEVKDTPVVIANDKLALLAPGAPTDIMKLSTVTRGDRFFEGDKVVNKDTSEVYGYVCYVQGFKMQALDGTVKEIPTDDYIQVEEGDSVSISDVVRGGNWKPITFICNGKEVQFHSFIMRVGDSIVMGDGTELVRCEDIRIPTGYYDEGRPVCFGDRRNGGVVCLRNNDVTVCRD